MVFIHKILLSKEKLISVKQISKIFIFYFKID